MQTHPRTQTENPSVGEIAALAYYIWELEGRPHGRDFEHWVKAEAQLKAAGQQASPDSTQQNTTLMRAGSIGRPQRPQRRAIHQKARVPQVR
ncbi:MAG: DUF2934 domain-containing protein [Verrucomicrobia bacterium]|nr:DUF2934 domain-containing protein [Verrucomicrobiota bacterium]